MKGGQECVVCGDNSAKYKCPVCRAPYCSVACCRSHKGERPSQPASCSERNFTTDERTNERTNEPHIPPCPAVPKKYLARSLKPNVKVWERRAPEPARLRSPRNRLSDRGRSCPPKRTPKTRTEPDLGASTSSPSHRATRFARLSVILILWRHLLTLTHLLKRNRPSTQPAKTQDSVSSPRKY